MSHTGTGPNVLLITTDMQRFDTYGPFAPEFLRTPHLNQLAREGAMFERAYAEAPICVPSRLSIMTGRSVHTHRAIGNAVSSDVIGREGTLPDLMRRAGYQTAAVGKMHFEPARARHGFDELILPDDYYRFMEQQPPQAPRPMRHGIGVNELHPALSTVPEAQTLTSWIVERCVDYISYRRDPTVPFFLWCSFTKPHHPYDPPEPYFSMYLDDEIPDPIESDWSRDDEVPPAFALWDRSLGTQDLPRSIIRAARAAYYGLITQVDYNIGRILAALTEAGLYDETLIIFASDHGTYLGDHRATSTMFFHEVSARVPLIVRLPRSVERDIAGTRTKALVTHADIYTTIANAAGAMPQEDSDGIDLADAARGDEGREIIVGASNLRWYRTELPAYVAITDGSLKYIWYPEGPCEQLFDIDEDPYEVHNLANDDRLETARSSLQQRVTEFVAEHWPEWLIDGRLPSLDPVAEPLHEIYRSAHPGYIGDNTTKDVRH